MSTVSTPAPRPISPERREWLASLYEAHFGAVYRVCSGILRDAEDAADAAQEVFLSAVDSLEPGAAANPTRAWLTTVARNHCIDVIRRRKRFGTALVSLGSEPQGSRDIEGAVADRHFVGSVIKQLPLKERQALWQSVVESRPLADIAQQLQMTYMAAAQVVHRARRHAALAAARVAVVVLGFLGIGRSRTGSGGALAIQRAIAVTALPVAAVMVIQSSSSDVAAKTPPGVVHSHLTRVASAPAGTTPSAAMPSSSTATSGTLGAGPAANLKHSLPLSPTALPLPGVTLPSALPQLSPLPVPSTSALPGAVAVPSLPPVVPTPIPLPR